MCDETSLSEDLEWLRARGLTRRAFAGGAAIAAVGLSACSMTGENAVAKAVGGLREATVAVPMTGGKTADAFFVHPASGKYPLVLMWPDIGGLRPAFERAARELAGEGFAVLCVNPYWRSARAPVLPAGQSFRDPDGRATLMKMVALLSSDTYASDARDFTRWADAQKGVDPSRRAGSIGHCMTGQATIRTAAAMPGRYGACASFHGGSLVTDKPDSPHLLIPATRAAFLFAIAENDDASEPDAKRVLKETCDKAGRPAEVSVYPARHGWTTYDSPVFDEEQAAAARARALALFKAL